ncbi:MAG: prolipoprotein diacylglyceryl transferase, partial [Chloroflexota bacterium]|nr:prolipoprotein diacylglyceryl transferase [Chloroflexota bacterium]
MVLAAIELGFDPFLRLQGLTVPWRALGVAGAVVLALLAAAAITRAARESISPNGRPDPGQDEGGSAEEPLEGGTSRVARVIQLDDLLYIAIAAVPGAVVLGRLVHGLTYLDFYWRDPISLLDPARGSLSLLGVVVGGALTGSYVAWTLGNPVPRCADVAAVPLLLAIGLGKLSQLLAAAGQGVEFGGPWAVSFAGPGPWSSVSPAVPAHPSQAY